MRNLTISTLVAVAACCLSLSCSEGPPAEEGANRLLPHLPKDPLFVAVWGVEDPVAGFDSVLELVRLIAAAEEGPDVPDLDQGLAKMNETLGISLRDDLLAHLGSEVAVTIDMPPPDQIMADLMSGSEEAIPETFGGIAVLASVREGEALTTSLTEMFRHQEAAVEETDGVFSVEFPVESPAPEGPPPPKLYWGIREGAFVMGISAERVRTALEGWPAGERLADGEDFEKVFRHLAPQPQSFTYVNLPRIRKMIDSSTMVQMAIHAKPEQKAVYDAVTRLIDTSMGIGATTVRVDDGTLQMTYGPSWISSGAASAGIVAAIAVPNFLNAVDRGKQKRTMADLRSIATAAEAYAIDNNVYPGPTRGLVPVGAIEGQIQPVYIRTLPPTDGWGHDFLFFSDGRRYVIVSPGKDGVLDRDWTRDDSGGGPRTNFNDDIVMTNGQFHQWPEGAQN